MSNSTSIQWTDVTDNILVVEGGGWWCRKISPGCMNCYAAKLNQSDFFGGNKLPYSGKPPPLVLRTDIIESWKRQQKPKKHFVCSMTDIFGEWIDQEIANTFLDGMCLQGHVFQLLTKRPQIMRDRVNGWLKARGYHSPPRSIWLGVSVEDQKRADERIPILLTIPAAVRFLSVEPMLERIDLHLPHRDAPGPAIDWVIVGGESGHNARLCMAEWLEDILRQCEDVHVAAFLKQFGSHAACSNVNRWDFADSVKLIETCCIEGAAAAGLGFKDRKGGDWLEWPKEFQVRRFPKL